jgi:hypothetical protein
MAKRPNGPRGEPKRYLTVPLTAPEAEAMQALQVKASSVAGRPVSAAEVVRAWIASGALAKNI